MAEESLVGGRGFGHWAASWLVRRWLAGPPAKRAWQNDDFLNPFDALIPKISFSFFAESWVPATSGSPGVSLGRIWGGGASIKPFFGILPPTAYLTISQAYLPDNPSSAHQ